MGVENDFFGRVVYLETENYLLQYPQSSGMTNAKFKIQNYNTSAV